MLHPSSLSANQHSHPLLGFLPPIHIYYWYHLSIMLSTALRVWLVCQILNFKCPVLHLIIFLMFYTFFLSFHFFACPLPQKGRGRKELVEKVQRQQCQCFKQLLPHRPSACHSAYQHLVSQKGSKCTCLMSYSSTDAFSEPPHERGKPT